MNSVASTSSRESQNTLFTALANHRRRFALYACNRADGELTLSDVAEQVAAWEYDKSVPEVTSSERKRVYTSLQQHHLPKLVEAELVEFDGDTIRLTAKAEQIDLYLEIVTEDTLPWSLYYLGFAAVGGCAVALAHYGFVPEQVTVTVMAMIVLAVLAISAIAHYYDTQRKHLDSEEVPDERE